MSKSRRLDERLITDKAIIVEGRDDVDALCRNAGLNMESFEKRGFCRLHSVIRKPV